MEKSLSQPVWKTKSGEIRCPGDSCSKKCDETCPIFLNTLGLQAMLFQMIEPAKEYFSKSLKIESDFSDAYVNLATCQGMQNNHEEALKNYVKAFELAPKKINCPRGIAIALKNLGRYKEAIEYCSICENIGYDETGKVQEIREYCEGKLKKAGKTQSEGKQKKSPIEFFKRVFNFIKK